MESNCLFNIPSHLHQNIKKKEYKSPESSPVIMTERLAKRNSVSFTESEFCSLTNPKAQNSIQNSPVKQKEILFKSLQKQKQKVNDMKDILANAEIHNND